MLKRLAIKYDMIKEVRGMGLMLAMEFKKPVASDMVKDALHNYLVLNKVSEYTLRFLPPLIISKRNINILINWLNKKIKEMSK
jgi:acetylornithine/N-succinyldiaminopimelate aminotransferase